MKLRYTIMLLTLIALAVTLSSAGFVYVTMNRMAAAEVEKVGSSHLSNLQHRLEARFSIYTRSAMTLARLSPIHAVLVKADATAMAQANYVLDTFTQTLEADACYLMDAHGQTIASSNRHTPSSFVGKNYGFRPYFRRALSGESAVYMAIGITSGKPGIYFSHPVTAMSEEKPVGVVVVKAPMVVFHKEIRDVHHQHDGFVGLVSPGGFVFISDSTDLQYRLLWPALPDRTAELEKSRQFGEGPFHWSGFRRLTGKTAVDTRERVFFVHEAAVACCPGWQIVHLTDQKAIQEMTSTPLKTAVGPVALIVLVVVGAAMFLLSGKAQRDLTLQQKAKASLTRQNAYMAALHDVSLAMINRLEIDDLLISVLNSACSLFGTRHAFFFLREPDGSAIRLQNAVGGIFDTDDGLRLRPGEGLSGRVWATGKPLRVNDYGRWKHRVNYDSHEALYAIVAVPVWTDKGVEGVFGLGYEKEATTIPQASDEILERLSELVAIALDNARLFGSAQQALNEREQAENKLLRSFDEVQIRKAEVTALLNASRTVLNAGRFEQTARSILEHCKEAVGAGAGCLSLRDETGKTENIVQMDPGDLSMTADASHPMSIAGLKADVYRSGHTLMNNDRAAAGIRELLPVDPMGIENALLAPLLDDGGAIGLLTLVNKPGGFSENDAKLAGAFADQAATALSKNRATEALKRSEARFRSVIEKNTDAIMVVDTEGFIRFANPMAETFFSRDAAGLVGSAFGLPISTGESTEIEILNAAGQTVIAEMRLVETEWEGETVYFASLRDVTERIQSEKERMRLEEQLLQAQKMEAIGTLAGGIAHDFNNILSAVIGFSEISVEMAEPGSLLRDNLEEVLKAGRRAKDLVHQILTFSRQSEQETQPLVIQYLAKEVLKMLRATLPTTIDIHQYLNSASTVMADPTQIHQILMNLCTNAGHAMRETGGILTVSLDDVVVGADDLPEHPDIPPGPYQKLTVADTGPGIPRSIRDRIFDPFFTTKDKGEGTGMGLSVVHGIAKHHGGFVHLESSPGKGAEFHVFFPLFEGPVKKETEEQPELPSGCERILVVDDEPPIGKLTKRSLEKLGYTVETFTDSVQVLDRFAADADGYDLLITDLTMPKMTGLQLAAAVKGIREDLPVILTTGFSGNIDETDLAASGIVALIRKPLIKGDLAITVREVLDGKPAYHNNPPNIKAV